MRLSDKDLDNILSALTSYEQNDLDENLEAEIESHYQTTKKIQKETLQRRKKKGK